MHGDKSESLTHGSDVSTNGNDKWDECWLDEGLGSICIDGESDTDARDGGRSTRGGREYCARCSRPCTVCLCESLPPEPIRTERVSALILQTTAEGRCAISTSPLCKAVLESCEICSVKRRVTIERVPRLRSLEKSGMLGSVLLLYPSENSVPLTSDLVMQKQSEYGQVHLLLLDGTWNQCMYMLDRSPDLLRLQQVMSSVEIYVCICV